jgi:hypothetical protein
MSLFIVVAAIIAVASAIGFIVFRAGTPAPTVSSMLRRDEKAGDRK